MSQSLSRRQAQETVEGFRVELSSCRQSDTARTKVEIEAYLDGTSWTSGCIDHRSDFSRLENRLLGCGRDGTRRGG